MGGPDIVQYSRFFVDATANSSYDPPVNVSDWFKDEPSQGSTFICNSTCGVQGPEAPTRTETDLPSEIDAAIVSNTLPTDGYDAETRWKGRCRLLRRPALEAYAPQYAAFKSAQANLPVGQLAYIAEQRATLFNLSPVQSTNIGSYLGDLNQKSRDLQILDSLQFLGAPIDAQRYAQISQQASAAAVQYEQYLNGLQATRLQQVQNLQQLNNAVVPDLAPAANQKTVNSILFNLFITNLMASSDLATLQSIAGQCPLEGGDAVYEARSLLRYYTGATFDDRQICALPSDRRQPQDNTMVLAAAEFIVYPNPASSQISWNLQSDDESATIRLYNALGQLKMEKQTSDNNLEVINMPQGIYRLVIQSASGSVRSANFVIQH